MSFLVAKRGSFLGGVWRERSGITSRAMLRDISVPYKALFEAENDDIGLEITRLRDIRTG
jgi:hypothetical protein